MEEESRMSVFPIELTGRVLLLFAKIRSTKGMGLERKMLNAV